MIGVSENLPSDDGEGELVAIGEGKTTTVSQFIWWSILPIGVGVGDMSSDIAGDSGTSKKLRQACDAYGDGASRDSAGGKRYVPLVKVFRLLRESENGLSSVSFRGKGLRESALIGENGRRTSL